MYLRFLAFTVGAMLICGSALASGVGDLCVRINNDFNAPDTVVIGRTNTIEVWIGNDDVLTGMSVYLEFDFPESVSWAMDGELPALGQYGRAFGDAPDGSCWTQSGLSIDGDVDGIVPDAVVFGGAAGASGGFAAGASELSYSLRFSVPEANQPQPESFCITFMALPPVGDFPFVDSEGNYPPSFCGLEFGSTICFDIAQIDWIAGDANRDGLVNVGDIVHLIRYIFGRGPAPYPYEAGDANCDGLVNITDAIFIVLYIFIDGMPPLGCD
ncbi:MAG: dockerin type I repeat-containing protein [bacterium]